jgi:acetylornithine deacetylase/succinyl-diaminopimelate desuccinylase-like protein
VEIRGRSETDLDGLEQRLRQRAALAHLTPVLRKAPVQMDLVAVEAVAMACSKMGLSARGMVSGAGHDAMWIPALGPTAMIFVPSRRGISHSPAEWTDWTDCARGAQVLLGALCLLDGK